MADQALFSNYPVRMKVRSEQPSLWYTRLTGYYALHGGAKPTPESSSLYSLDEEQITVCRGKPKENNAGDLEGVTLSPVYTLESGGSLAVPSGRVFVRFAKHVTAKNQRGKLLQAGYEITEIPSYAPHTVWVSANSGEIADALNKISTLESLPEVENVEPQMLWQRDRKISSPA